jgi:hypothetical protein
MLKCPLGEGLRDELGARASVEFGAEQTNIPFDGRFSAPQLNGDFFAVQPIGQRLQNRYFHAR